MEGGKRKGFKLNSLLGLIIVVLIDDCFILKVLYVLVLLIIFRCSSDVFGS